MQKKKKKKKIIRFDMCDHDLHKMHEFIIISSNTQLLFPES